MMSVTVLSCRNIAVGALVALLLLLCSPEARGGGGAYSLGEGDSVIGLPGSYTLRGGESLHEAALNAGLGYGEVAQANPGVDPWLPGDGTEIVLPTMWVLPQAPREGIVVNLAEMRLYHYFEADGRRLVRTFPIGIGREAFDTPTGSYTVAQKLQNPSWTVPKSIRAENPSLPAIVPPGPENPLGRFALRLSDPSYLIHGTNRPLGIGRRVSHGCIRMYPGDIAALFKAVAPGTPVRIVYQPVKVGRRDGAVFVEAHRGYIEEDESALWERAVGLLAEGGLLGETDSALLHRALGELTGLPLSVTSGETSAAEADPF